MSRRRDGEGRCSVITFRGVSFSIKWEPRDLWIGVYWTNSFYECFRDAVYKHGNHWCLYVCIVPCVPILIQFFTRPKSGAA